MISSQKIQEIKNVVRNSLLSKDTKDKHLRSLESLRRKAEDNNIYIGVVGEFSSGKSTLLNSLLDETFFVMKSMQGTTTIPCMIRYGETLELSIFNKDGCHLSSKGNCAKLLKTYIPDYYSSLSFLERTNMGFADFFDSGHDRIHLSKLFDILSTSNEYYNEIDYLELKLSSEFLKGGIVMIDTPGIDSLNFNHQKITERTLKDLCDLAMIVSPADHAYSQTLSSFISEHVLNTLDYIVFVVTKCELIKNPAERESIKKYVCKKCDQELERDDVKAYLAPTRLDLLTKNLAERDKSDDRIYELPEDDRKTLLVNYANDVRNCIVEISNNRERIIESKFRYLSQGIIKALKDELVKIKLDINSELQNLISQRKATLRDFIQQQPFTSFFELQNTQALVRLDNSIKTKGQEIISEIHRHIDNSCSMDNPKNTIQRIMNQDNIHTIRNKYYEICYSTFCQIRSGVYESICNEIMKFSKSLAKTYGITPPALVSKVNSKSKRKLPYRRKSYNKEGLTTGLFARSRMSVSSVCSEMKAHTKRFLNAEIDNLQNYYNNLLETAIKEYVEEVVRYLNKIENKYKTSVDQQLAEHNKKEQLLQSKSNSISKSISDIELLIRAKI